MQLRAAKLELTGAEVAKRMAAGELEPIEVETREAFEQAVAVMLRTGRPIVVPSAKALEDWEWSLDPQDWSVDEGDTYDG